MKPYKIQQEPNNTSLQKKSSTIILSQEDSGNCENAAKRLSQLISWMKDNERTEIFLCEFAHNASCGVAECSPFCMMFRRLRQHVISANHQCVLLSLYSRLLHLHVDSCNNDNCGLQSCKIQRANMRVKKWVVTDLELWGSVPNQAELTQEE